MSASRTPEGFLITASGVPYKKMKPEHVVEMDLDGGYVGDYLPSTEWRMHLDIFKHRPEAGAIVHTHSTYATALACLRKDIPGLPLHDRHRRRHRHQAAPTMPSSAPRSSSTAMLKALEGRSRLPARQSRPDRLRPQSRKGTVAAGEVETLAHQYWAALQAGKPVLLDDKQMTTVLARFKTYGKQSPRTPRPANWCSIPISTGPRRCSTNVSGMPSTTR
jgi:L-fuculose-phosphate aldolase